MAFSGTTFSKLFNWLTDPQRNEKIFNARLDAEFGGIATGLTILASRTVTPNAGGLTIASGAITVTGSYHTVDTEAAGASDDLDTINGGVDGARLVIRAVDSTHTVVAKDATGNLQLAGDHTMDNAQDTLTLIYDGALTAWLELARSNNGA